MWWHVRPQVRHVRPQAKPNIGHNSNSILSWEFEFGVELELDKKLSKTSKSSQAKSEGSNTFTKKSIPTPQSQPR